MNSLEVSTSTSDARWLSLGSNIDTDLFLKAGAVVQDELINGNLADWIPELGWEWSDGVDDDDDAGSDADESDDEMEANAEDVNEAAAPVAVVVTHTPQVRRKAKPVPVTAFDSKRQKL